MRSLRIPTIIDDDRRNFHLHRDRVPAQGNEAWIVLREGTPPCEVHRLDTSPVLGDSRAFNCSLMNWKGRNLLALRYQTPDARLAVLELDDDYRITGGRKLDLPPARGRTLHEDPRFFVQQDQLWIASTCAELMSNLWFNHVRLTRLSDDLTPVEHGRVAYANCDMQEKNWSFFTWENRLYCLYSISPHLVMAIEDYTATIAHRVDWNPRFEGGSMRGGASPVLHRGEFYHWFHGVIVDTAGRRYYSIGVYTFAARPPFEPLRQIEHALLLPDVDEAPDGSVPHAVFPCGALFNNLDDCWWVSYGYYDRWCRLAKWSRLDVEAALVAV